ncbi:MAG: mechanosensitive ion channel [Methyloprofundus sp.]|nr:mechanosensitive ion channel [Methyloprofundus sp.]
MKKTPLKIALLFLISYCSYLTVQAETEATTGVAPTEISKEAASQKNSDHAKAKELLANIDQLSKQSINLKKKFKKVPAIDLLLIISLVAETEKELRDELDAVIVIQQKMEANAPDTQQLLQEIQTISNLQAAILKEESANLEKIINQLRKEDSQDNKTKFAIKRAKQAKYELLTAWQQNIERQKILGMDVTQSSEDLGSTVQYIAISQTGRIRLILDTMNEINSYMETATEDEKKNLEKQLGQLEWKKASEAENLEKMIAIMQELEMNTTKFGQALVLATGKILNEQVEAKAVIGLFKQLIGNATIWFKTNLPIIVFRILAFIGIILLFRIIAGFIRGLINKATSAKAETSQLLHNFLGSIVHKIIMLLGIIIALSQLGIEIGPLLAGMGVMGFVVGFALQDALSNFASGLMILIYRPFDIDDFVDVAGISGKVKQMNLVSTTILTFDRKRMIIPNNKIWGDIITNVSAESIRRVDLVFGIGYNDSMAHAEQVLKSIIDADDRILKEPETTIKVNTLGASSVDFIVRPWVKSSDYWGVYWDITRIVKERFDAEGISFPYPQSDIHVIQEHKPS